MSEEKKSAELTEEQLDKVQGGLYSTHGMGTEAKAKVFQQTETAGNSSKKEHEFRERVSLSYQKL